MLQSAVLACALLAAGATAQAAVDTYVPRSDSEVVETLRLRPLERADREFRQGRALLRNQPDDAGVAAAVAKRAIELARRDGDPRYLGQAEAALAPWWADPAAPIELRLIKATILQSVHRFDDALRELDAVLATRPADAQAWLTRASILQVQGRLVEASASCSRLSELGTEPYATACLAELGSLSAQVSSRGASPAGARPVAPAVASAATDAAARTRAIAARARLEQLFAAPDGRDADSRAWLHLMLAELAERIGDSAAAERAFRLALAGNPDAYTRGAFADFLLDRRRAAEVLTLLEGEERNDGLLLRLAIARAQVGSVDAARDTAALESRFAAARLRGDSLHRREEARFELQLQRRPERAVSLALANWAVQKEPADARLLLDAARAAGDDDAAEPVRRYLAEHRPYDVRLSAARP